MQPAHFLFERRAATRALYLRRGSAIGTLSSPRVVAGHSRTKDGVASLAYDPAIHDEAQRATSVRY
jgi:hypothetical protein